MKERKRGRRNEKETKGHERNKNNALFFIRDRENYREGRISSQNSWRDTKH